MRWVVVIIFATTHALQAQNYNLSPGDSIVSTAEFDDLTVYNILQNNISSDTLWLSYEKIMADIPSQWEAVSCDNVNCYTYLKESGDMNPVPVDDYGLMSIHLTPHINPGTAFIQYAVWETNNISLRDTLTWIISAELTGIENESASLFSWYLADEQLFLQNADRIRLINLHGEILVDEKARSPFEVIDLSQFPTGIYIVEASNNTFQKTKKIFLK